MKEVTQLEALAKVHGLEFAKKAHYHFHLKGIFLVNVYPTKGTYYIQGTNGGTPYRSLEELCLVAKGEKNIPFADVRTQRVAMTKLRKELYEKFQGCFYCGNKIETYEEATVEHKIPISRGGSNRRDNLTLSHHECNQRRGNDLKVSRA